MSPRSATSFAQRAIMEDSDLASEAKHSHRGMKFNGIKLENVPVITDDRFGKLHRYSSANN